MKKTFIIARLVSIMLLLSCLSNTVSCSKDNADAKYESWRGIPVLTYHRVATHEIKEKYYKDNKWVNCLDDFTSNMQYLYDNGYKTLSMDEFCDWYYGKVEYDTEKTVLITFDDGDMENYYNVLPVLKNFGFKATVFVVGTNTEKSNGVFDEIKQSFMDEATLEKMRKEYPDFEIQSHTYDMHKKLGGEYAIRLADRDTLVEDFAKMSDAGYEYCAYPYGVKTDAALEAFLQSEFKLVFGFGQPDLPYRRAMRTDSKAYIARIKVDGNNGTPEKFPELLNKEGIS